MASTCILSSNKCRTWLTNKSNCGVVELCLQKPNWKSVIEWQRKSNILLKVMCSSTLNMEHNNEMVDSC